MLLCATCHARSSCRAEVHLDILHQAKCSGCGCTASCFQCGNVTASSRRAIYAPASIAQYRNTKLLKAYRKINI